MKTKLCFLLWLYKSGSCIHSNILHAFNSKKLSMVLLLSPKTHLFHFFNFSKLGCYIKVSLYYTRERFPFQEFFFETILPLVWRPSVMIFKIVVTGKVMCVWVKAFLASCKFLADGGCLETGYWTSWTTGITWGERKDAYLKKTCA